MACVCVCVCVFFISSRRTCQMLLSMLPCLEILQIDGDETKKQELAFYINHCINWGSGGVFPEVSKGKIVFVEAVSDQHAHSGFDPV